MKARPIKDRLMEKIERVPESGCWIFTGSMNHKGYGQIHWNGKTRTVHKVSWILHNGEIPKGEGSHGTCVLHKCDVACCINPDHLYLGTNTHNVHDMYKRGRYPLKLTSVQVDEIKSLRGQDTYTAIGKKYGIDRTYVRLIQEGKFRNHEWK